MKSFKRTNALIAFLLLTVTLNACSMDEPEPKKKPSKSQRLMGYLTIAGNIIIGKLPRKAISELSNETSFLDLTQDVQQKIIGLLIIASTTDTIEESLKAISALAQVNKELNSLINDPQFCLQLIKKLAAKYDTSDFAACLQLRTQEGKRRYEIQSSLLSLCKDENPLKERFEFLYAQGADLNFIYSFETQLVTPLMISALEGNVSMVDYLLEKPMVIINKKGTQGETALMYAAQGNNTIIIQKLCSKMTPEQINAQNNNGDTALVYCFKRINLLKTQLAINALLKAGMDPNIKNQQGKSAKDFIKNYSLLKAAFFPEEK